MRKPPPLVGSRPHRHRASLRATPSAGCQAAPRAILPSAGDAHAQTGRRRLRTHALLRGQAQRAPVGSILLLLLLALAACAGPRVAEPRDTGELVFWEVQAPGGARAYLLGTVHVGRDASAFDPAIQEALGEARTLVMEVDPGELDPVQMSQLLLQKGLLDDQRTLRDVLAPETWERLRERLEARGIPARNVLPMEPWVALFTLLGSELGAQGFEAEHGVEQQVLTGSPSMPVLALESAAFQLELFDALPMERQARLLRGFLESSSGAQDARHAVEQLIEAWRRGDLEALETLGMPGRGEDEDADALYEVLYLQRNRAMARRLGELLAQPPAPTPFFVMIGALHMVGEQGVPTLLAERGLAVRRIPRSGHGGS